MAWAFSACSAFSAFRGALVFAVVSGSLTPSVASADDGAEPFRAGLAEMLAGRYDAGCPLLAESYKIAPRPGTLFTLAECERKRGRTASALARYDEFLTLVARLPEVQKKQQVERAEVAAVERRALDSSVPRLSVRLAEGAPPRTSVSLDGSPLARAALGTEIAVDPGEHVVRVEASGMPARELRVTLLDGERRTLVAEPTAHPNTQGAASGSRASAEPADARRPWIYATLGLGAVALAVAGTTGALALVNASKAKDDCDARGVCRSASGVDAGNAARTFANVETVALVVLGASVGAAAVLWLTRPRASSTSRSVGAQLHVAIGSDGLPRAGITAAW